MKRIIHLFVLTVLLIMGGQTFAQNKHEYVDLGLPSGTLWATCNVGATSPEDYGDYYAWGETSTKDTYYWTNYKYANGAHNKLTKYFHLEEERPESLLARRRQPLGCRAPRRWHRSPLLVEFALWRPVYGVAFLLHTVHALCG